MKKVKIEIRELMEMERFTNLCGYYALKEFSTLQK